ncbi:hypothetical protein P5673_017513 [Acropora cervicornis]|uniref:Uncharacterized protein n=1 Tax=Acropora cervicornis TaxID=6130 RepID=A0AAD9V3K2_ACRCE|nr:hypothetical protein P5673_017513 [Acropora cervicornis]
MPFQVPFCVIPPYCPSGDRSIGRSKFRYWISAVPTSKRNTCLISSIAKGADFNIVDRKMER